MESRQQLQEKVGQIMQELKMQQLWESIPPVWVTRFKVCEIPQNDFAQWLQFIYLPNLLQPGTANSIQASVFLVPQAIEYFGSDVCKGKLLQLLVELDSLT
ncbi:MAG: hypothetical protein EOP51_23900 [Sphingobacteriales bacterium]|nr:MAG: hypothetical protein EOP51_23900 [Sphingobacteriales bacterium]